ncbi:MAG: OmpH family outer membrane protein [Chitinophagales bacterium]|nr:OmpH family outer membrane protein [Chitinophagales bacterium]
MKKTLTLVFLSFFVLANPVWAQQKYGHIDSDEIRDAMPEYKQLVATMQKARQQKEAKLKSMYADYQKRTVELSEHQYTLMEAVLEEKSMELAKLQEDIQVYEQSIESDLAEMQMKRLKPLNDKYLKIVNQVASENGYDFVFDIATGSLAYYPDNEGDITTLVKKKMGIQ